MRLRRASHVAFADESNWNVTAGPYCSLCVVSGRRDETLAIHRELADSLKESDVSELKWKKLTSAKYGFAAGKLVDLIVPCCASGRLRIDTLIWDINDSRHNIRGRDDSENLGRMFFHLLRYVLDRCWPDSSSWAIYPDERSGYDWGALREALRSKGTQALVEFDLFAPEGAVGLRQSFKILGLEEQDSAMHPLIQVADLFAGLGQYSRFKYAKYEEWLRATGEQQNLFPARMPGLSTAQRERFPLLRHLDRACKARKLGVSLRTFGGLTTLDRRQPINFWRYEPQHEADRAPTRSG